MRNQETHMTAAKRRWQKVVLIAGLLAVINVAPAFAQSPSPSFTFHDYKPGVINLSGLGVVVEGLGSGGCSFSLSSIESTTATYVNDSEGVITELSPQSVCSTISGYESMFASIISYMAAHAPHAGTYWGGIMVDEESGFGFSVSQLQTLNNDLAGKMLRTPGISWWYSEVFSGQGNWSQADYNGIVIPFNGGSARSPQIPSSYMVQLVNGCNCAPNLVTWSTGYPAPYNSESASDGAVNGQPWNQDFYGCGCAVYWDNQFTPV